AAILERLVGSADLERLAAGPVLFTERQRAIVARARESGDPRVLDELVHGEPEALPHSRETCASGWREAQAPQPEGGRVAAKRPPSDLLRRAAGERSSRQLRGRARGGNAGA